MTAATIRLWLAALSRDERDAKIAAAKERIEAAEKKRQEDKRKREQAKADKLRKGST